MCFPTAEAPRGERGFQHRQTRENLGQLLVISSGDRLTVPVAPLSAGQSVTASVSAGRVSKPAEFKSEIYEIWTQKRIQFATDTEVHGDQTGVKPALYRISAGSIILSVSGAFFFAARTINKYKTTSLKSVSIQSVECRI